MRKLQVLGLVLFAVLVFSAVAATAAFAESEWLVEGTALAGELPAETEGLLILKNYEKNNTTVLVEVHCTGIFKGTIGPGGLDLVDDVLSLDHSLTVVTLEEGDENKTPLDCLVILDGGALTDCTQEEASELNLANVWVDNLNLELGLT